MSRTNEETARYMREYRAKHRERMNERRRELYSYEKRREQYQRWKERQWQKINTGNSS